MDTIKTNNPLKIDIANFECNKYTPDFLKQVNNYCADIMDNIRTDLKGRMIPIVKSHEDWMTIKELAETFSISPSCAKDWLNNQLYLCSAVSVHSPEIPNNKWSGIACNNRYAWRLADGTIVLCGQKRMTQYYLRTKCDEYNEPIGTPKKCSYSYFTTVYKAFSAN